MTVSALYRPLTAFSAYGVGLQSTAHNLANVLTPGFKAGTVGYSEISGGQGVRAIPRPNNENAPTALSTTDVPSEMVNLNIISRTYQANGAVVKTADAMLGTVINMFA